MKDQLLLNKIKQYEDAKMNDLFVRSEDSGELTIKHIREYLMIHGSIVEEDLDLNCYVAYIKSGLFKMNRTMIAVRIEAGKIIIAGFSRNNITNHEGNEKVVNKIFDELVLKKNQKIG